MFFFVKRILQDGVLGLLCETKLYYSFCRNLDGFPGGGVTTLARVAALLYEFAKSWDGEFTLFLGFYICELDQGLKHFAYFFASLAKFLSKSLE